MNSNGVHRTRRTSQPLLSNTHSKPNGRRRHDEITVDKFDFDRVTDALEAIGATLAGDAPAKVKLGRLCLILSIMEKEGYIEPDA
jgi:hypothetical protein